MIIFYSLQFICDNFELICYGITWRSSGWRNFVKNGHYLSVESPLKQLPVHVLCELAQVSDPSKTKYRVFFSSMWIKEQNKTLQVVIDDLGCAPHILHSLIQPHLTSLRLPPVVNTIPLAVKLIVERTHKLNTFELSSCRVRK